MGELDGLEHAVGEVFELDVGGGGAVEGEDAGGDDGEEFGRGGDGRRGGEEVADAVDLLVGDVDEEDVGEVGLGGEVELLDDGVLHEEDEHDLHDAHAERGEQRGGRVAGAVKVGEAVAEDGGEVEAGAGEEELEGFEDDPGGEQEDGEDAGEADGEPLADGVGV